MGKFTDSIFLASALQNLKIKKNPNGFSEHPVRTFLSVERCRLIIPEKIFGDQSLNDIGFTQKGFLSKEEKFLVI